MRKTSMLTAIILAAAISGALGSWADAPWD